jgi:hypothetical protein
MDDPLHPISNTGSMIKTNKSHNTALSSKHIYMASIDAEESVEQKSPYRGTIL